MMTERLIDLIMAHPLLQKEPPILLDIGASGFAHRPWQRIARHAHCVAFDGDCRDMAHVEVTSQRYKKFHVFSSIVGEHASSGESFYLTRSPACSSLLRPVARSLEPWLFSPLFDVTETVTAPVMTIRQALDSIGLSTVDWFKADSQGTDLRLFRSLGEIGVARVLVAEFEPGIIDAYRGEDKLHEVFAFMDSKPFWLAEMTVKGTSRIHKSDIGCYTGDIAGILAAHLVRRAPCWAELAYLRCEKDCIDLGLRATLLACVFALLYRHYGAAHQIACLGHEKYRDPLLMMVAARCKKMLQLGPLNCLAAGLRAALGSARARWRGQ